MNKKKPYVYKRVIAYIIDLLIVTLLSGIVTMLFINNTDYENDSMILVELTKKLADKEITSEEYYKQFDNLNYDLTKDSVSVTAITCAISLVYFVVLCYYCDGITLGKYIMKLRIISSDDKKLNLGNFFLRSLVVNMILSNLLTIVLVSVLSKESFVGFYSKIENVFTILMVVSFILVMYRNDGRGIHDFMGNTKVVSLKSEDIKDAQIIGEKEEVKE